MSYYEALQAKKRHEKRVDAQRSRAFAMFTEKKELYLDQFLIQILFLAATLVGILVGLAPDQKSLSLTGTCTLLLAQMLLCTSSILIVISFVVRMIAYGKYGNVLSLHYQIKRDDPTYDRNYVSGSLPFSYWLLIFLAAITFFLAMFSLMVFCVSVAWPKLSTLGIFN